MRLHENKKLFRQSISATSDRLGISEIYIEKDYWVVFALKAIFAHDIGKDTVFKGGTALSKCFGLIERFSEDVDLVMVRREGEGNSKMERKVKMPSKVVDAVLPEIQVDTVTHKKGMLRKTAHEYQKQFKGSFGQVRDFIVLEASYLGRYEPYYTTTINSFIGEMMLEVDQSRIAEEYEVLPVEVQVMHENRTLCEKIMSLVRFSYGENPITQLQDKIRHTYDLHQLLNLEGISLFFESSEFEEMLKQVAEDDKLSFKTDNDWMNNHPKDALLFRDTNDTWAQLKDVYTNDFANLVYGKLPSAQDVSQTLRRISQRLQQL